MRTVTRLFLTPLRFVSALSLGGAVTRSHADDGRIIVKIHEAVALKKNSDALGSEQQDFYVCSSLDQAPAFIAGPKISDRDHASWNPPGYLDKVVPGKN